MRLDQITELNVPGRRIRKPLPYRFVDLGSLNLRWASLSGISESNKAQAEQIRQGWSIARTSWGIVVLPSSLYYASVNEPGLNCRARGGWRWARGRKLESSRRSCPHVLPPGNWHWGEGLA